MSEELYFIKTNPTIAKINLYNKLCREEENILKFLQTDRNTDLEIIKDKVKDSVEELTKEELLHIFSWFSTIYPSDHEEIKTQLFINGIDLFYEIPSTAHVNGFLEILSDYEKNVHQHLDFIVNAQNFNQFLIYGIFFTEIINKGQGQENILSDYLKPDYESLYQLAEHQLNIKNNIEKSNPQLQHYFMDLYDLTKFYKGSIIQLENQ
ncbi:hypothetical protein EGI16_13285 [Chryseobacterium sp. G0240]|uniref:hypothetical protein n=1 Tax=Chryseobacterium sp. G0240 TaxID=2487066 RepID=UPI000F449FAD|nr:hypothetical protein [Chryseobacterium sp. G0240]ROI02598.1 hypothetical protein EGI16_13285 [Chryseobacterium sp. G0240]